MDSPISNVAQSGENSKGGFPDAKPRDRMTIVNVEKDFSEPFGKTNPIHYPY